MKDIKNLSILDRLLRVIISEILFIVWYFWLWWITEIILLVLSFIALFTSIIWFCPLYLPFKFNTFKKNNKLSKSIIVFLIILIISLLSAGSYYSIFFSKKIFLEDYNVMNNYYKQTLFNTWKDNRDESIVNYDLLVENYNNFYNKYSSYKPYVVKCDSLFESDLITIDLKIKELKDEVYTWDLQKSHLSLETIRPIFQELLKRNNFSMLAVSLVDFHDVMEKVIDASDTKDITLLNTAYLEADEKLKAVEIEANDEEIKAIRNSLEEIKSLADNWELDKLSDKAQELKTNFVKVYLKRG